MYCGTAFCQLDVKHKYIISIPVTLDLGESQDTARSIRFAAKKTITDEMPTLTCTNPHMFQTHNQYTRIATIQLAFPSHMQPRHNDLQIRKTSVFSYTHRTHTKHHTWTSRKNNIKHRYATASSKELWRFLLLKVPPENTRVYFEANTPVLGIYIAKLT